MMGPARPNRESVDLLQTKPDWAQDLLLRLSLRRALSGLHELTQNRRVRASVVSGAIDVMQDLGKAVRAFTVMAGWAALLVACYAWSGEALTAVVWACNTPILLLHARRAAKVRSKASLMLA